MNRDDVKKIGRFISALLIIGIIALILNMLRTELNIKDVFFESVVFSILFYCSFYLIANEKKVIQKLYIVKQIYVPVLFVTVFWDLAFLAPKTDKSNFIAFYGLCSLNLLAILLTRILKKSAVKMTISEIRKKAVDMIKENWLLIVICLCFVIGCIPNFSTWLNEDGLVYYKKLSSLQEWNFTDLGQLQMAAHHTELYTIMLMIGEYLFPNNAIGVKLICICMAILTVLAFDGILKKLLPESEHKIERHILVGIFAFSPYLYGMLPEINSDFPVLCFFVWMMYFYLKKSYIMQAFCGLLLCFSKETGCLVYGAYVIGIIICIIIANRKNIHKMIEELTGKVMALHIAAGVLWIFFFLGIQFRLWRGAGSEPVETEGLVYKLNSFGVWGEYILFRLKEIFLFNFNWIFFGVIVIGIIAIIVKRKRLSVQNIKNIVPLVCSTVVILLFNILYITFTHIRYNSFFLCVQVVLFGMVTIFLIKKMKIRRIILVLVLAITLVSNYLTDPVSEQLFPSVNTGNGRIVCPRLFYEINGYCALYDDSINYSQYNEGIAYNRQYTGRGYCIENLLKQIDYQQGDLIIIPDVAENKELTYRNAVLRLDAWSEGKMYWNTKTKKTNANFYFDEELYAQEEWVKINTVILENQQAVSEEWFDQYDRVFYLKLPMETEFDYEYAFGKYKTAGYIAERNVWKIELYEIWK